MPKWMDANGPPVDWLDQGSWPNWLEIGNFRFSISASYSPNSDRPAHAVVRTNLLRPVFVQGKATLERDWFRADEALPASVLKWEQEPFVREGPSPVITLRKFGEALAERIGSNAAEFSYGRDG